MLTEIFVVIEEGAVVGSVYHDLLVEFEYFDKFDYSQARELKYFFIDGLIAVLLEVFG